MGYSTILLQVVLRAGLSGLLGLLVGLALGGPWIGITLGLSVYLLWTLWQLVRFEHWLRRRASEQPPDFGGPWGEVVALATRLYRRKQFHKRRVTQLFREFRQMTAAMPDGVIVLSGQDEIQWFNRRAADMIGLRRKLDFGQKIQNLVRHPDFVRFLDSARLGEGGAGVPAVGGTVIIPSPRDADSRLSFHLIAAYGLGQRLLLVRDSTREARVESMRRDFVANASHELRSPLTVVTGYLDTLADEPELDETWQHPVEEMRRQMVRMREIVDSLLELSRLEAATGEAPFEAVDLAGLVALLRRDAMSALTHPAVFDVDIQAPSRVLGAPSEVHSIVANLISNAVKYTPETGTVTVTWRVDASGGHLEVRDTGIGISSEHLPRLTERFYRVDAGRSRKQGGTGLGLAIVKHAVNRHGGTLSIESVDGKGSTFTCHFPARRVPAVTTL
jgi:two-component system phosphate regulon sensor histidine kinase PhoR